MDENRIFTIYLSLYFNYNKIRKSKKFPKIFYFFFHSVILNYTSTVNSQC